MHVLGKCNMRKFSALQYCAVLCVLIQSSEICDFETKYLPCLFFHQAKLSTCQRWRSRVLNLPGFLVPPGVFIPDCAQNGSFRTVQCSGSTGLCWCVTKEGYMIWTTTTRGTPNCIKKGGYINSASGHL